MTKGRSIRLFLADGTPGGIITAEIINWTGHIIVAPRSRLADLIKRPEAARTGIYFLTGTDPEGGLRPLVYIGETDNVANRLTQHNKDQSKSFWEQTCFITSKDQNLTKAHVRYLESRLIQITTDASRAKLKNETSPRYWQLPEADLADMEFFIDQVRTILPVLGQDLLRETGMITTQNIQNQLNTNPNATPTFELYSPKHDLTATAAEIDGDFVVLADSWARGGRSESYNSYRTLRDALQHDGALVEEDGYLRFTRNTPFKSPSAASSVILDRQDNGRTTWKVQGTNKTFAAWQEEQVAAVTPDAVGEGA